MKAFVDTSILVAAFYSEHERHEPSFAVMLSCDYRSACTAGHCLAELYAVLTGMPGKHRVSPDQALLFIKDIRERLRVVVLTDLEYLTVLKTAANLGISGGGIYDVIIGHCASKAKAETLYTWNVKRFTRLGAELAARVRTP